MDADPVKNPPGGFMRKRFRVYRDYVTVSVGRFDYGLKRPVFAKAHGFCVGVVRQQSPWPTLIVVYVGLWKMRFSLLCEYAD